jgi:hypothetical protein
MFCTHCRAPLAEGAKFCKVCGKVAAVAAVCPHCQSPLAAEAKFCRVCGAVLTQTKMDAPAPATPSVAPPPESPALDTAPIPPEKKKKRGWAFLLAGLFVLLAAGIAAYVALSGKEADAPEGSPQAAESAVTQTPSVQPETSSTVQPETSSTVQPETSAARPEEASSVLPEASPAPPVKASAPPVKASAPPPRTASERRSAPAAEKTPAPAPAPPKTCDGLSGFSILLCRTEGAARFWRCVPDGINWNNDIPGCRRDAGVRSRPY